MKFSCIKEGDSFRIIEAEGSIPDGPCILYSAPPAINSSVDLAFPDDDESWTPILESLTQGETP